MAIYVTSDLHFAHDKDFIYGVRGFDNVREMNEAIIRNWNSLVRAEDTVYILGDVIMGDSKETIHYLDRLAGRKIIICGNHDSRTRKQLYREHNCIVVDGYYLDYRGYHFYLSHFPVNCSNNDSDKPLRRRVLGLSGHTHSKEIFEPTGSYNVGMDAHNCFPVLLDDVIQAFKDRREGCPCHAQ